jgi:hypothetical protein
MKYNNNIISWNIAYITLFFNRLLSEVITAVWLFHFLTNSRSYSLL